MTEGFGKIHRWPWLLSSVELGCKVTWCWSPQVGSLAVLPALRKGWRLLCSSVKHWGVWGTLNHLAGLTNRWHPCGPSSHMTALWSFLQKFGNQDPVYHWFWLVKYFRCSGSFIKKFQASQNTIAHKFWPFLIWYRLSLYQSSCRTPLVFFWLCVLKKGFGEWVLNGFDLRRGNGVGRGSAF